MQTSNFTGEQINFIKKKIDLYPIVFQYTDLKPRARNFTGHCPFCTSIAFTLTPVKRIYKCFACGKGGNIINFIGDLENLSFPESIKFIQTKFHRTLDKLPDKENELRGNIYALELEDNHYYIGFTRNVKNRMISHFNNQGALWTKKHKPIKVLEIHENRTLEYENILTEKYIDKYGYDKVRGGDHIYFNKKYAKK
ncbi:MAG: CHC2 zinc finger domain-containing protein [Bacteroidia bacterium]